MNIKLSTNYCRFNQMFANVLSIFVVLAMAFPVTTVAYAATNSPFIGQWRANDPDGSEIRLTIAGRPEGPFQITWTESYIGFCDGEAGIVRGTGRLNEDNPNLLEADLHLECFTTGASLDFLSAWRYHLATNRLSSSWNGIVTIWRRPGGGQVQEPPVLGLRVNYGHDWVESFYEGGHTAWITVTDGDGNLKATAELITEPKDFWGGETGFQTQGLDWFDADGNQMGYPPDIQPYDWVYGWMDNGASAQVQIGEITGEIDLANDAIDGTVNAPWFVNEGNPVKVEIDCHSWGAPLPEEILKYDAILSDGEDPYSCSWYGEWDIQPGQDVGVGYSGPDGHWVANAFYVRPLVLYIHYEYPDVVEGDYELGHTVQVTVFDSESNTKATATVETMEMPHWGGAPGFRVEQWDGIEGPPDIQPGDVVRAVVDDGFLTTEARVGEIAATIDLEANSVTGTIDASWAGDTVNILCMPWGAPGGAVDKETSVIPDGVNEFTCSWDSEWDIQPGEMVGVAYWGNDLHWMANVISNPYIWAFPEANQVFGYGWPVGSDVTLTINNEEIATVNVEGAPWDENDIMAYFDFGGIHDLVADDVVMLSGSGMERTHIVQNLTVTEVNMETNTVSGTADSGDTVHAWVHGFGHDVWLTVADGVWSAYFGSDEFHLQSGMCGRAEIRVEGNNSTNVDWCTPPKMDLRVNYGHDWVESFYEAGHAISIQVTDSEGNVKATAEVFTAPRDEWEGAEGFQTRPVDWSPEPPDLQPYDWVYAQVDNGATAQVQLGDIQGEVRFQEDSVTGTILAPWITDSVQVECLDWGSGQEPPFNTIQDGSILTDESESYSCSWEEWDVQPWQDIGVGYFTPDGHWVANAFRDERWMAFWTYTPDPSTGLFPEGEHLYTFEWAYTAPVPGNGISGPRTITVAEDSTPSYDGFALIGPWGLDYPGNFRPQLARTGSACEGVSVLGSDQPMRFVWGWVNDYSMTYEEALAHYTSFTIAVFWDFFSDEITDGSATLATMSDLLRFTGRDARFEYLCTFTEH